ncbi:MAG: hypothetical protein LBJ67_15835, partial [Planctomycetaceae bacterium]|nr:hypothetical protein [Planctomycetaceae bacterium]
MNMQLQIIGAGGHAKVVIQTARVAGFEPVAVFDDNAALYGQTLCGVSIVGDVSDIKKTKIKSII